VSDADAATIGPGSLSIRGGGRRQHAIVGDQQQKRPKETKSPESLAPWNALFLSRGINLPGEMRR
jgi:hypothetical protein